MAIISNAVTMADAGAFSVSLGSQVLIKTLTASSSSDLTFVDGASSVVLDTTYPLYLFKFINLHFSNNACNFQVNFRDGGSNYDASKTSSFFSVSHTEGGSAAGPSRDDSRAEDASTNVQALGQNIGSGNDECLSGHMYLFNPGNTTFQKQFMATVNYYQEADKSESVYVGGYCDVTAAIDGVQFNSSAGTIDSGSIKLYGIKDS
jgi:hypothetical protein